MRKAITLHILLLLFASLVITTHAQIAFPHYTVKIPNNIKLYDKASFDVELKLLLIYNGTQRVPIGIMIPMYVNNFWSSVEIEKIIPVKGSLSFSSVGYYDLNKYLPMSRSYAEVPSSIRDTYGFSHHVIALGLGTQAPREETIVIVKMHVVVSRVDGSSLALNPGGTVNDAKKELGEDYYTFTMPTYYWDYNTSVVQQVINEIRQRLIAKYHKPIGQIRAYDIVKELLNWISYNVYYMDRFDYPYSRLKASQILNTTIEVEGKKKHYGVCRHIVDLFVALARGLGVPANRYEGMIFSYANGQIDLLGFHAWAEVYLPKIGWVPVEVTITSPYERDLVDVGDAEFAYYVPYIHEYNAYKPPMLPQILISVLSVNVTSAKAIGPSEIIPSVVYVPGIGRLPIKDFIIVTVILLLIADNIYLHRKIFRYRSLLTSKE
ncbi:MAG: transglutaminase domain-containing protein [Thermoprotei archaeon]|nr:transglutaminase domain-containing protein [Thermoprotei archaeon]